MFVIINGPPGVGKTSVSRILATLRPGTVCIHGDDLRAFAPDDPRAHLGGGSTYRASATLATAYLRMGATRVVFDYCFLRPRHVAYFIDGLPANVPVQFFTLWASLPIVHARERRREGRSPLGTAVAECHREIEVHLSELGTVVDAEDRDAETIAMSIDARLRAQ
jgi:predicted kinase